MKYLLNVVFYIIDLQTPFKATQGLLYAVGVVTSRLCRRGAYLRVSGP